MTMLEHALRAHRAGLCVLAPSNGGSKIPATRSWKGFIETRSSERQIREWYANGKLTGLGVVLGEVSGGPEGNPLELLEIDDRRLHAAFERRVRQEGLGSVWERVSSGYFELSPNGLHWLYRYERVDPETGEIRVDGNQKLAAAADGKTLIETRGHGGFAIVAPTYGNVHPTGQPYRHIRGGFEQIATITQAEREAIFDVARMFNLAPERARLPQSGPKARPEGRERPGDYFARTRSWGEVLEPHGWIFRGHRGEEELWQRPGKRHSGVSATTNYAGSDVLKVFSTSCEHFAPGETFSKFMAYAILNHGGNLADAAREIGREMTQGVNREHSPAIGAAQR